MATRRSARFVRTAKYRMQARFARRTAEILRITTSAMPTHFKRRKVMTNRTACADQASATTALQLIRSQILEIGAPNVLWGLFRMATLVTAALHVTQSLLDRSPLPPSEQDLVNASATLPKVLRRMAHPTVACVRQERAMMAPIAEAVLMANTRLISATLNAQAVANTPLPMDPARAPALIASVRHLLSQVQTVLAYVKPDTVTIATPDSVVYVLKENLVTVFRWTSAHRVPLVPTSPPSWHSQATTA